MKPQTTVLTLLAASSLLLGLACSGGGGGTSQPQPTPNATSLAYTDPATGTWQLKKNTGLSTANRLVLDIVASGAGQGAGIAFHVTVDGTKATWAKVADTDPEYIRNGTVFNLGSGVQAIRGKVSGSTLQAVVSQKGLAGSPTLNGTVATVALTLNSGVTPGAVSLSVVSGKAQVLTAAGETPTLTLALGTLTAQ